MTALLEGFMVATSSSHCLATLYQVGVLLSCEIWPVFGTSVWYFMIEKLSDDNQSTQIVWPSLQERGCYVIALPVRGATETI